MMMMMILRRFRFNQSPGGLVRVGPRHSGCNHWQAAATSGRTVWDGEGEEERGLCESSAWPEPEVRRHRQAQPEAA
eukprot:2215762-Rhodomonas_salina.4